MRAGEGGGRGRGRGREGGGGRGGGIVYNVYKTSNGFGIIVIAFSQRNHSPQLIFSFTTESLTRAAACSPLYNSPGTMYAVTLLASRYVYMVNVCR